MIDSIESSTIAITTDQTNEGLLFTFSLLLFNRIYSDTTTKVETTAMLEMAESTGKIYSFNKSHMMSFYFIYFKDLIMEITTEQANEG